MDEFNELARSILEAEGFTVEANRAIKDKILLAKYSKAHPKKRQVRINEYLLYYNGVRVGSSNGVLKDILLVLKKFEASDHRPEPQVKARDGVTLHGTCNAEPIPGMSGVVSPDDTLQNNDDGSFTIIRKKDSI